MNNDPVPLPSTRALRYWGIYAGGFYDPKPPKGHSNSMPWGFVIKIKRGAQQSGGGKNSAPCGRRHTRFYQGKYGRRPMAKR
jgi:hypothetical protein